MELVIVWIIVGVVTGLAAQARGRSFLGWTVLGVLFSFLALIAVLVMRPVETAGAARPGERLPDQRSRPRAPDPAEPQGYLETYRGFDLFRRGEDVWVRDRAFPNQAAARAHADALADGTAEPELYRDHAITRTAEGQARAMGRTFADANAARAAIDEALRPVD